MSTNENEKLSGKLTLTIYNLSKTDTISIWLENEVNLENRLDLLDSLANNNNSNKNIKLVIIKPEQNYVFIKKSDICFITLINNTTKRWELDRNETSEAKLYFDENQLKTLIELKPKCNKDSETLKQIAANRGGNKCERGINCVAKYQSEDDLQYLYYYYPFVMNVASKLFLHPTITKLSSRIQFCNLINLCLISQI